MTDNFQEFENAETEHHEELPPTPVGFRANLTHAWRSQPLFKLFVLMVSVGAIVAVAVSLFSGGNIKSSVGLARPPELHEAPGGKSSPYLQEQTDMANKHRTEEAMQSGGSALPTPIGPGTESGELSPNTPKEDPLNELRAEVADMNKQLQDAKQAQVAPPAPPPPPEPFDDSLAQAMQRQMGQLLDSWVPKSNKLVEIYDLDVLNREKQAEIDKANQANQAIALGTSATPPAKTIVPAGTVSYAQLLTEANSDVPGPILAQLVSGPLKGARIIGQFQVSNGYSDYLTMTFKLANLKGTDYKIDAIALDPDTTLGGMATEVDQRYLMRLVLPAAAAFLQGFAGSLGQGNSSLSTNGTTTIIQQSGKSFQQGEYSGLSSAAQTAGQFFQNQANQTMPLVRVAAGTPMGIFFVETVTDAPSQPGVQPACTSPTPGVSNPLLGTNGCPPGQVPVAQPLGGYYGQPTPAYGQPGVYGQGYGQPGAYGATPGGGYPVLYPTATQPLTTPAYGGFGAVPQVTTPGYPGSTVYYTH